jgi:uncharacterized membrane protein
MSRLERLLASPSGRRLHLAKMITWRVLGTASTIFVLFLFTGNLLIGAAVGGIEAATKMILYYGHERVWARLVRPSESEPDTFELVGQS